MSFPLPTGWQSNLFPDGLAGFLSNGQGEFIYLDVEQVDPTTNDAAGLLAANIQIFLPPEYYTNLQTSDVQTLPPFGNVLTMAVVAYRAVYVDSQSSFPVFGNMWIAVRQDGKTLVATAESTPETRFEELQLWREIIDPAFNSFGFPQ